MRRVLFVFFIFIFSARVWGHTCASVFYNPQHRVFQRHIDHLSERDLATFDTLIYMHLGHDSLASFFKRGFLDFEFYYAPNISPRGSGDRHYKLLMHYSEYTQTIIYNSKTFKVVERQTRENW